MYRAGAQVDLARLLLRSQVAALQKFGGLPAQPLASMLGTSGLHTLAEARQKLPGPERAAATAALEPPEEPRSSRAAAKQVSPACILQQWVCPARAGAGQAGAAPGGFRSLAGNRENLSSNLPEQQLPNLVKACPFAPPRTLTTHLCNPTTA